MNLRSGENHISGFFHCAFTRINKNDVTHGLIVELAPIGATCTDCIHVTAGFQPRAL